jgi:hypothetical protein
MAVLIEALTLVVRTRDLDIRYPGGSYAFLNACLTLPRPPRFICSADPHLVNLSYYDAEHLESSVALLYDNGFTDVEENRFVDMAYVDQHHGPTMPCDWLEWRRHRDGFTLAWLAGTEPGDMAAPEEWTPAQSLATRRSDIRDDPDRAMPLAEEDGIETWLDLTTGRVVAGLAHRPGEDAGERGDDMARPAAGGAAEPSPAGSPAGTAADGPAEAAADVEDLDLDAILRELELEFEHAAALMEVVLATLTEKGWSYERKGEWHVTFHLKGENAVYSTIVSVNPSTEVLSCLMSTTLRVPEARRAPVCELLTRANWEMPLVALEMDLSDGEVRCRTAMDMEGGTVVPRMVDNFVSAPLWAYDHYFPALVRVAYAGASAEEALAALER